MRSLRNTRLRVRASVPWLAALVLLLPITGAAAACRIGFEPGQPAGLVLPEGETLAIRAAGVSSVRNLGATPVSVRLNFNGQQDQLTLSPGQRVPANPRLSFAPDTTLEAASCTALLKPAIDLIPITGARRSPFAVFRIDPNQTATAITGFRANQPQFSPFHPVLPASLCNGLTPPGRHPAGPLASRPLRIELEDLRWGVAALHGQPDRPVFIRLFGGLHPPQQITVQPNQFRPSGRNQFQAVFRTRRSQRQAEVYRLGEDGGTCWARVDSATTHDAGTLIAVDTANQFIEPREDNNQKPYWED